jgi:hypothetical protein
MLDWSARLDDLAFHLATQYRIEDRAAVEILLSALVACPRTSAPWLVLETNWFLRDCESGWFSLGGVWQPGSLPLLRAMRSRNANSLIATWLNEPPQGRLFVECDYDGRLPRYRAVSEIRFLLARSLRLRVASTPDGVTRPADERAGETRADQLRALAASVLDDPVGARSPDPPAWREPANFLYHTEVTVRLAARHSDYGQTAIALRSLAIRHAHLYGRMETDEEDWSLLARVAADSVPPWIRRAIQYLSAAPNHQAETRTRAREMRLDPSHHPECARLHRGLFTYNQSAQIWGLAPDHIRGVTDVVAGRAFQPLAVTEARSVHR